MSRKTFFLSFKPLFLFVAVMASLSGPLAMPTYGADLPLAAGSPLAGFNFDDRPLLLPVQRNFQMAMLTSSSELGRSCGKMEAYGWRMNQAEQQRVNQIFNNTVDRLRGLGYSIEAQAPTSISHDITLFTADRPDKHFLFMWSAGEIGLVMTLCETSRPISQRSATAPWPSTQNFTQDVVQSNLEAAAPAGLHKTVAANFSPVGSWVGDYICAQGYTAATMTISRLDKDRFQGTFHFYPTPKNPNVPEGRYTIYGQYDRDSQRMLINPGKWLQRPKDFYYTVMVGGFDPIRRNFSAYFQGINGCTSFEAKFVGKPSDLFKNAVAKKKKAVKKTKKAAKPTTTKITSPVLGATPPTTPVVIDSTTAPPASNGATSPSVPAATATTPATVAPAAPAADEPASSINLPTPGTAPTK